MIEFPSITVSQICLDKDKYPDMGLACAEITRSIASYLGKVGIPRLDRLNIKGATLVMYYLYGAGLVSEAMLNNFIRHPKLEGSSWITIKFDPDNEQDRSYMVLVEFSTETEVFRDHQSK